MAYVYGHYTADTNKLFYIGKGTGDRAWSTRGRNPYWTRVVNKHGYKVTILCDNLSDEDAFTKEKELINEIGLDNLTNLAEGGKGFTSNLMQYLKEHTDWHENVTDANRKNANNPEKLKKQSERMKRLWCEDEWKQQHMESRTFYSDPDWKHKISDGVKQKYEDSNYHQKITDINRQRGQDTDWREKQRDIANELVQTTEWREKYEVGLVKRANNPEWKRKHIETHAKTYTGFISPDGTVYTDVFNLSEFARTHGLLVKKLRNVHKGTAKIHRGWTKYTPPTT